uniref:C-methyltransferase C-terminal domain-containing protein n=1 Tax=Candidatus Kentrum sp. SD TaxID=2126332 RepID=A0A450YN16_9GAMM|nr:MAG: C-methyltransferase C-terminal domain-containing protein [Candidatus Kentron sp. SD]VFK42954.1 MAG: C-methyltransferase C-terminal domain-containing protein [Candidatus Kentron sp. SD]VFK78589.1 MAG: C-methyltransferase C-terminal domain-containing protein [Candidatus Kentron sp. SD]
MKSIMLPIIPNSPITKTEKTKEGKFLLKRFGEFGLVKNVLFDESLIEYNGSYQNDQSNSGVFKEHMFSVYHILKERFPKGSDLVEVGCGKGAFLDIVKNDGYFSYKGFDAAYEGGDKRIELRYLTSEDSIIADVVVLRHTLEHIKSPFMFLKLLKKIFSPNALVFIEVPQFNWIEKNKVLFDFSYEHVNYFTSKALCSMFSDVESFDDLFGGQYQYCLANLTSLTDVGWDSFDNEEKWNKFDFSSFVNSFQSSIKHLEEYDRIWIWGGATKGVLFLKHLLDISPSFFNRIVGVVDINPKKQGLFTPSTKLEIVPPSTLYDFCNDGDVVLVMNPNYCGEVKDSIARSVGKRVSVLSL